MSEDSENDFYWQGYKAGMLAEREACAKLIEEVQETQRNDANGTTYYVSPRGKGNLAGLAYAAAIRERTNS